MIHTVNWITMRAPVDLVYQTAADVWQWPRILPHYRYVRELSEQQEGGTERRVARMSASRSGIPVFWTAEQVLQPECREIHYHHTGGVTTGMNVVWRLEPYGSVVRVSIDHRWEPSAGPVRIGVVGHIVGVGFVQHVADRTLQAMKAYVERVAGIVP